MNYATKYRPKSLDELVGHAAVRKSLARFEDSGYPHAFLLTGPSGVGKTTIARIIAARVGAAVAGIREINAADATGVDAWRDVIPSLAYAPLQGKATFVIVDECHMLSKSAWNVLLKPIEDAAAHVYWALCTTEPRKVPATIRTRCADIVLESVKRSELRTLLERVAKAEALDLPRTYVDLLVAYADGSPRQALTGLEMVAGADDEAAARELLQAPGEVDEAVSLARLIFGRKVPLWGDAMAIVNAIENPNAEAIRRTVEAYGVAVCRKDKNVDPRFLSNLEAFAVPYQAGSSSLAPLLLSCAKVIFEHD